MTSPKPTSSSAPIKIRGQTVVFSPPKHVDVSALVLKKHPTCAPPPPSSPKNDTLTQKEKVKRPLSPTIEETKRAKKNPSTVIVMGSAPYQRLELSSSDDSSNTKSTSTAISHYCDQFRSKSVSPSPAPRNKIPSSSVSLRAFTPSPEPIDWVAFSDPQEAYEEYGSVDYDGSRSEDSWSDDDSSTPAIITPEQSQPTRRVSFNLQDLAIALNQPSYILPPTPPPTPPSTSTANKRRKISKSPSLSIIPSVSTPSTPYNIDIPLPQSPSSLSAPGRLFDLASARLDLDLQLSEECSAPYDESSEEEQEIPEVQCTACGKNVEMKKANKMIPCGHITCSACFSSTISAVSPARTYSQCVACATNLLTFERLKNVPSDTLQELIDPSVQRFNNYQIPVASQNHGSVIMRIDNIAWDMTPDIVEEFLPPGTLAEQVPQAIHIPLDRYDGRTKDFLYIEAASLDAAKHILQTRQNSYMPGGRSTGGKKRPVTITIVSHAELVSELRPQSSQELHSLLQLCHMGLGPPTPASRFVKSRHGPFYALMSIMSKLTGKGSPAYWDLFHVASGAISALAQAISRSNYHQSSFRNNDHTPGPAAEEDDVVFTRLLYLFEKCFGMAPAVV